MAFLDDIASDLRIMTNGEFSRPVVVNATGHAAFTINGLFDRNSLDVDGDGLTVISDNAQCSVYLPDIEDVLGYEIDEESNLSFAIMSKNYKIKKVMRDVESLGVIILKVV